MVRLLGILVGATIAVAVLIIVVGVPEFPDKPVPAAGKDVPFELPPDPGPPQTREPSPPAPEPGVETAPAEVTADDIADAPLAQADGARAEPVEALPELPDISPDQPPSRWYAFWSPFRSELAANGFIAQLQRTTGLDYRVVKQKPGVYEVAFAYVDDADIEQKLEQISAATGLDLPET